MVAAERSSARATNDGTFSGIALADDTILFARRFNRCGRIAMRGSHV
jgi:hypothetical protein